ncbi:uncharacterized protein LOC129797725 [Lutzomyia longipalpis]|nr:uncharacterized protein LOC129797725 [Lutzomyia longipalpis]
MSKKASPNLWDKKKTMQLISKYNETPILWDTNSKDYRNRELRAKSFEELARSMKLSKQEVQRKLHNLRTQYNTELRKIQKSGKPGEVKWEYYDAIKFINPGSTRPCFEDIKPNHNLDVNSSFSNLEYRDIPSVASTTGVLGREEDDTTRDHILLLEGYDDQPSSRTFRTQGISSRDDHEDHHHTSKHRGSLVDAPRDDLQIFGDFVASELRSLNSDEKRKKLRLAIQRAILDVNEQP